MKKHRKPRSTKLDGTKSRDMCPGCFAFDCDPFLMSLAFNEKIRRRLRLGLCPACGHYPCKCKSKKDY
jgi:hypothetical protein